VEFKVIATVRVVPEDPDNPEQEDKAMDFEYKTEDYDEFTKFLHLHKDITDFEWTGNAFSIEGAKEAIEQFRDLVQKKYPDLKIDIEWDYWID
jgi:hypothetical protein